MRKIGFALLSLCAFAAGPAVAEEKKPVAPNPYVVLEEDADIPFARTRVSSFTVGEDNSLILQVGVSRFYRATLSGPCARDLKFEHRIAIDYDGSGRFDRFSKVFVDGQRCFVQSVDRIESPRLTKKKAAEAAAAAQT